MKQFLLFLLLPTLSFSQSQDVAINPTTHSVIQSAVDYTNTQITGTSTGILKSTGSGTVIATSGSDYLYPATTVETLASLPKLQHWRLARSRILAGSGSDANVLIIGDSISEGIGTGTAGGNIRANVRMTSWPSQLASRLTAVGIPALAQAHCGGGCNVSGGDTLPGIDSRWVLNGSWANPGSGWVGNPVTDMLGGYLVTFINGSSGTAVFSPTQPWASFDLYYTVKSTNGIMGIQIDSGSVSQLNCATGTAAGPYCNKTNYAAPSYAMHTITFSKPVDLSNNSFEAIVPRASQGVVQIINASQAGCTVAQQSGAADSCTTNYNGAAMIQVFAPDLTIIMLTTNDAGAGTNTANYTSQMNQIVTAASATGGNVIFCSAPPPQNTPYSTNISTYNGICKQLAQSNGFPFIDINALYENSWTDMNNLGAYGDSLHPSLSGAALISDAVFKAITQ